RSASSPTTAARGPGSPCCIAPWDATPTRIARSKTCSAPRRRRKPAPWRPSSGPCSGNPRKRGALEFLDPMRALLLAALASAAALQAGPADQSGTAGRAGQAPTPVFRSGTDLVRFDVRVTGPDGRPIKDLRPDEIDIIEDGAARPILLFQHMEE